MKNALQFHFSLCIVPC